MSDPARLVVEHYGRRDLQARLQQLLVAGGVADRAPTTEWLAPFDQFHTGGLDASRALLARAGIDRGARVLDVGGGIGGPARLLARELGCAVTVVDLTPEYCAAGAWLTDRCGLGERVTFRCGSATALPIGAGVVDVVWTQHCAMNVADKAALYREAFRVLRPGGTLALHDVMLGPAAAPQFPVPWAADPAASFLVPPAAIEELLRAAGFVDVAAEDVTADGLAWARDRARASADAVAAGWPAPGLPALLGADFTVAFGNHVRNLAAGHIVVVSMVCRRPAR